MNPNLDQQVQHLGQLRAQRKQFEAQEQQLARAVRSQMAEHGQSVVTSDDYEAKLTTQQRLTVDPAAFRRAASRKEFLEAVTVNITAAREILGERTLRQISEVTETVQLRIIERTRRSSAVDERSTSTEQFDKGRT